MLELLTKNFRELLKKFEGASCPLCSVLKWREQQRLERLRASGVSTRVLCGPHLEMALAALAIRTARARLARSAIESVLAGRPDCEVCSWLCQIELRLVRAIRGLDGGMRFQKALESAPLFCRRHVKAIAEQNAGANFAHVQKAKLLLLRNALAQAELRNSEELESLISKTLAYLAAPVDQASSAEVLEFSDSTESDAAEFGRWEDARQLKHLSDLESEAASLRYRNATLAEENRRLKLAHAAGEALRRDLEHDREQFIAAAKAQDPNSVKSSNRN